MDEECLQLNHKLRKLQKIERQENPWIKPELMKIEPVVIPKS